MVQMKYIDVDGPAGAAKSPGGFATVSDLGARRCFSWQFEFSGGIGAKLRKRAQRHENFFRDHGFREGSMLKKLRLHPKIQNRNA